MLVTRINTAQLHPSLPQENTVVRSIASKQREGSLSGNLDFLIRMKDLTLESDRPELDLAPTHMKWEVLIATSTFLICKTKTIIPNS